MKRFKVAVEPDASLTFTGCAAAGPDIGALAQLRFGASGRAPDGTAGVASSHAKMTPPMAISANVMTEETISFRALILSHQLNPNAVALPRHVGAHTDGRQSLR